MWVGGNWGTLYLGTAVASGTFGRHNSVNLFYSHTGVKPLELPNTSKDIY